MKALLITLLVASLALAGCNDGKKASPTGDAGDEATLKSGKGAISGLVINDIYRPVPDALVLASNGMTATSDASGQFAFTNLEPGIYILRVQAEGHEAAPQNVDVVEGEYAEVELLARRILNEGGRMITTEYSVFVPCAAGFIVNGITANCLLDLSGDSYRSSFTTNLTAEHNVTYMITEWKFNQIGDWNVQIREDDGSSAGGERYATLDIAQGDYARVVLQRGVLNTEANAQRNNVIWNNTKEFATAVFLNGQFKDDAQSAVDPLCQPDVDPTCVTTTGVGASFAIKARIIQTVFVGEPEVDVQTYNALG